MRTLALDLETYSSVNLTKAGVYAYTSATDFEILLLAYAFDEDEVEVIDLAQGETVPNKVLSAIQDKSVIKTAFNASFERTALSRYLGIQLTAEDWRCSEVQAAMLSLPLSLEAVGEVLGLEKQKLKEGKELIRYFCMPCKPTRTNENRTRNLPSHAKEKWEQFKYYCKRDVEVERAIRKKLASYPISETEQKLYVLDQEINDRGILVDTLLVKNAIKGDREYKEKVTRCARALTGLDNPNSVAQLKTWLSDNDLSTKSLSKKSVGELVTCTTGQVKQLLEMRLELAKTSVKKYEAIDRAICPDKRVRGLLQYYGANRTGRWAGRLVQVHNLPQNHLKDLTLARSLVRQGNLETLELLYDSVPNILSELIRTAFIPSNGRRFIVADFSAIEARVIAWLAGEAWRLDVFKTHGKIYEASASQMFKIPIEEITKGSPLRQKGKVAELACIAEGELVLTHQGLVPIEKVKLTHKLWDGEHWVSHQGVIYRGVKEVMEYEGLKATGDHIVWVKGKSKPIRFKEAATCGSRLLQTGNGRRAIRMGKNYIIRKALEQKLEQMLCFNTVRKMQKYSMDAIRELKRRQIKRVPKLFTTKTDTILVRQKINSCQATLSKSQRWKLSSVWIKGSRIPIQFYCRGRSVDIKKCGKCIKKFRTRQNRCQWSLRSGKSEICFKTYKPREQAANCTFRMETGILALFKNCDNKNAFFRENQRRNYLLGSIGRKGKKKMLAAYTGKVRVYDIQNAGPNNRFTVSNCLVHNCGYGGSVGALKAMGALEMGLQEEELRTLITDWRAANPNITKLWWTVDKAALKAVKERVPQAVGKLTFHYERGILFITLPSGRRLSYIRPRIEINKFGREGLTYEGIGENKHWCRIETYGPKLVENIVQATARDLLAEAMLAIRDRGYEIVIHVHDEVVVEAPLEKGSLEELCELMAISPTWAEDLPLRADGFECEYYKKD